MASEDASFAAPFKLVSKRNDHIHALVAYFDLSVTMCHRMMIIRYSKTTDKNVYDAIASLSMFRTHETIRKCKAGPKYRATHWKQKVLYLEDVLTICAGEMITGSMTIAPNKKNPRDVDIKLSYSLNGQHCKPYSTK